MTALAIQDIKLDRITENPANPRRVFKELDELAESIKRQGVLSPILVRPKGKGFELIFGARRFRAAQLAGVAAVPAMVRELDDKQALEIIIVENAQRADVHPLEEAQAFQVLQDEHGYDVAGIAAKVSRSPTYVRDRMRLLTLIKDARELFLADRITPAHANLLARLTPEQQDQALDPYGQALFEHEALLFDHDDIGEDEHADLRLRTVRQFSEWIDRNCRLEPKAVETPVLFPELTETLAKAEEKTAKVIHLSTQPRVDAENKGDERIYLPEHWRKVESDESCDYAVTGVIVLGEGRGNALQVCTAKKECRTHWLAEIRARAAADKEASGKTDGPAKAESWRDTYRKEEEKREAAKKRWKKALPAILEALEKRVAQLSVDADCELVEVLCGALGDYGRKMKTPPAKATPAQVIKYLAHAVLERRARDEWRAYSEFPKVAKSLGIDTKALLDEHAPEEKAAKASAKKGKAKR